MQKVLLAIDGISPDKKAVHYALGLCKSIKADLSVLQVINPRNYGRYIKNLGMRINQVRKYMEGAMIAAAFAEAGEHEIAKALKEQAMENLDQLMTESERAAVHCHVCMKSGSPGKEIVDYVNDHRDIVLTIYDAPREETTDTNKKTRTGVIPRLIMNQLTTPLVVIKA